jgi:hypothetical protein
MVQEADGLFLREVMADQGRMPRWVMERMNWTKQMFQDRIHGEVVLTTEEVSRLRRLLVERGPALAAERLYDATRYHPVRVALRRGPRSQPR